MNKIELIGRLCADPDFRTTQSGTAICRFRIAVNRRFKNQQTGEYDADFIGCTAWRQTAEFVSRYFRKGSMIAVVGSLRNNDYTDQNGVKHYSMDVLAEEVYFCGKSENATQSQQAAAQQPQAVNSQSYGTSPSVPDTGAQNAPQAHTYEKDVQRPQQMAQLGDLGDFEEILSDGDVPF